MIEVNLLPEELRKKDERIDILAELPIQRGAIIFVIAFFVIQCLASVYAFYLSSHFKATQAKIEKMTLANKQITEQKAFTMAVKKKIEKGEVVAHRPFYWAAFLNALSDSTTKGIWFTSISVFNDGKVSQLKLQGSVYSGGGEETAYIGKFIKELKSNAFFNEVFEEIQLPPINQKKIKDFDVYDFTILCNFKKGKS